MKKLSKVLPFTNGLKTVAALAAGMVTGGAAVGLMTAHKNPQETVVKIPAVEAFELTPAQMQEVMTTLRSLREMAEDNLEKELPWVNAQIAVKLRHTLGEMVDASASSTELLGLIDAALADLNASLMRTNDHGLER